MAKILRFAVVILLLYVAWDQAMPWIRQELGTAMPDVTAEGPARCVYLGGRANDTFGERVGRVSGPGGDAGAWEQFVGDVNAQIEAAQSGCRCRQASCQNVVRAMNDLEDLLDQLDMRFRGGTPRVNPVQRQIGINELLNEARILVREGK